jgi:hypothetical protein
MSTMAEEQVTDDLVNISDLESLWDETPPVCEVIWRSVPCGNEAAWKFKCACPCCNHAGEIFVCQPCHDLITSGGFRVQCNACFYSPMHQEWKPL